MIPARNLRGDKPLGHIALSAAILLAACDKPAPASEVSPGSFPPVPDTARFEAPKQMLGPEFVNSVAAHDTYELASARLALQTSRSRRIKALAQAMIADQQVTAHRKAAQALDTYASFGDRPALRQFAVRKAQVVRAHLGQLQGLYR